MFKMIDDGRFTVELPGWAPLAVIAVVAVLAVGAMITTVPGNAEAAAPAPHEDGYVDSLSADVEGGSSIDIYCFAGNLIVVSQPEANQVGVGGSSVAISGDSFCKND